MSRFMASKLQRRAFIQLCSCLAIDSIAWSLAFPVYYSCQDELGVTTVLSGWLTSFLCILTFISTPLVGYISDKIGRRICLQVSSLSACAGHLVCFFAGTKETYIMGRMLSSPFKCCLAVSQAYLSDLVEHECEGEGGAVKSRSRLGYMGRLLASLNFAWVLGPICGGYVGDHFGIRAPWCLAGMLHGLNFLVATCLPTVPIRSQKGQMDERARREDDAFDTENKGRGMGTGEAQGGMRRSKRIAMMTKKEGGNAPRAQQEQGEAEAATSLSKKKEKRDSAKLSVGCLLHLKFFFHLGNVIYETLFSTYIKDSLALDSAIVGTITGYCLGWVGVLNGLTNAYLLNPVELHFGHSHMLPGGIALTMACGILGWCSCTSLPMLVFWSSLVAVAQSLWSGLLVEYITRDVPANRKSSSIVFLQNVDRTARIAGAPLAGYVREEMGFSGVGMLAGGLHLCVLCFLAGQEALRLGQRVAGMGGKKKVE